MPEPTLVRAVLQTYTGDHDRDHDSCINVAARCADHNTMICEMLLGLCSGQYGYGEHEPHTDGIPLSPGANQLTYSQCAAFEWTMGITPTGHDEWNFDAWLILYFSDGSWNWSDKLGQDVNADDPFNHKVPMFQLGYGNTRTRPPFSPLEGLLAPLCRETAEALTAKTKSPSRQKGKSQ